MDIEKVLSDDRTSQAAIGLTASVFEKLVPHFEIRKTYSDLSERMFKDIHCFKRTGVEQGLDCTPKTGVTKLTVLGE